MAFGSHSLCRLIIERTPARAQVLPNHRLRPQIRCPQQRLQRNENGTGPILTRWETCTCCLSCQFTAVSRQTGTTRWTIRRLQAKTFGYAPPPIGRAIGTRTPHAATKGLQFFLVVRAVDALNPLVWQLDWAGRQDRPLVIGRYLGSADQVDKLLIRLELRQLGGQLLHCIDGVHRRKRATQHGDRSKRLGRKEFLFAASA
jgi:hypothetical protein